MQSLYRKLYDIVTDAKETEHPNDFVEENAPANFSRLLLAQTGITIGNRLSSQKTTLV
jgi:hypothetical protein